MLVNWSSDCWQESEESDETDSEEDSSFWAVGMKEVCNFFSKGFLEWLPLY